MLLVIQYFQSLRSGKKFLLTNSWASCHLVYTELENLIYKYGEFRGKFHSLLFRSCQGTILHVMVSLCVCDSFPPTSPWTSFFKNVCRAQKRQYISLLSKGEIFFFKPMHFGRAVVVNMSCLFTVPTKLPCCPSLAWWNLGLLIHFAVCQWMIYIFCQGEMYVGE